MVTRYWKHQVIDIGSVTAVVNPNNNYGARLAVAGTGLNDVLVRSRLHGFFSVSVHEFGAQMPEGWELNPQCIVALWCDEGSGVTPITSTINPSTHPDPSPGWLMVSMPGPRFSAVVVPNVTPGYVCPLPEDGINSEAKRSNHFPGSGRTSRVWVVWSAHSGLAPDYNSGHGGALFADLGGKFYVSTLWESP